MLNVVQSLKKNVFCLKLLMFIGEESLKNIFPCDLGAFCSSNVKLVSNKAKGRISKRVFQENKARQIFRKTNISYPLIRTLFYLFISVCFSEKPPGLWLAFIECYGLLTVQSSRGALFKGGALRNFTKFTGKHLCQSTFKKETLAQVFSSEFCKIFENIFFLQNTSRRLLLC